MINDPNQFSREAWDANAEHWDSRMGDEGNDFFNTKRRPYLTNVARVYWWARDKVEPIGEIIWNRG